MVSKYWLSKAWTGAGGCIGRRLRLSVLGTMAMVSLLVVQGCGNQPILPKTDPIPGGGKWQAFARSPVPFHESAAAVMGGKLYYVGGRLPNGPIATLYCYEPPPVDGWTQLSSHPGTAVDHMGAAVVDGILYAIGGTTEFPGPSVSHVYAYDPATDTWTTQSPLPQVLGAMGIGAVDGKIYLIGGLSGSQTSNVVFEYDPTSDQWTDLTSICPMPTPRDHCVAATVNDKIHMIGGRQLDVYSIMDVHEVFDPVARTWETKASMPTARAGFAAAVLNGKILIMGGEGALNSSGVFSENEEYDPATDTWRTLSPMITPRHSTQAGVIDAVVYVAGGAPQIFRTYTDAHEGFSFQFE